MVDVARQLLDELMGRNRNQDPQRQTETHWSDDEFCQFYLVKFCPNDLFVNTRVDLGACNKIHDEEAKRMFEEAKRCPRKQQYEDDFLRFCVNMINDVDRRIVKGKQRLQLMNSKGEPGASNATTPTTTTSGMSAAAAATAPPTTATTKPQTKAQEAINAMTEKINKLMKEVEEAGTRGDVDQAQGLLKICDQVKEERDGMMKSQESLGWTPQEFAAVQEKQMEVCEVCGAFLIIGDVQQRIDDHLCGKQHLGYLQLRKAVEQLTEDRRKEREEMRKKREEERMKSAERRDRDRDRDRKRDRDRRGHYHRRSRSRSRKRSHSKYDSPSRPERRDRDRERRHHSRRSRSR